MDIDWNRSETIALAKESCTHCHGNGLRQYGKESRNIPCNCVLRNIFRACHSRFRSCVEKERHMSHARLEMVAGRDRRQCWGRKDEEYIADFCLVSKRILDEYEYKIFRFHFLLGADWRLCCRQLKLERGVFFHIIYRIQQKLGRAFREIQPYSLFPLDEYFGGRVMKALPGERRVVQLTPRSKVLRPPLKKVA